jgi:hypothetical protein
MELNLQLIRKILLEYEVERFGPPRILQIEGYQHSTVTDHIEGLHRRGYLIAYMPIGEAFELAFAEIETLTPKGESLLLKAHDDAAWEAIKHL